MNIKELYEGAEPKMPGAPAGIKIMTPQQFVASAGDMPDEESKEDVAEGAMKDLDIDLQDQQWDSIVGYVINGLKKNMDIGRMELNLYKYAGQEMFDVDQALEDRGFRDIKDLANHIKQHNGRYVSPTDFDLGKGVTEGFFGTDDKIKGKIQNLVSRLSDEYGMWDHKAQTFTPQGLETLKSMLKFNEKYIKYALSLTHKDYEAEGVAEGSSENAWNAGISDEDFINKFGRSEFNRLTKRYGISSIPVPDLVGYRTKEPTDRAVRLHRGLDGPGAKLKSIIKQQGVAEGQEHLDRIRQLSGLDEATKLPASSREFGGDEFQDYMKRIVGTPDLDKEGKPKVDKKGIEKYVSGKTKTDRYKMPYIHRSSVIEYLGPDGQTYDEELVKKTLAQRPKALLKQNEKMKHSNGEFEQFFNVGFAALTGIALDEDTNKLIIVNTCPGAGSCKVDCFAMKGGKIQFKNAWQSDGRILTYLLNDPDGFFDQLSAEISKEENAGKKGDKKFPNGWQTTIRWHDAGDFFSPEYLDLALKMAAKHPDTKFYAYTKMAGAALGKKPPNFIINWSEGAHTSQEKQVKAKDKDLDTTKNSRIVPDELFQDLLVKDEKKNLVKGSEGQWQVQPDKLPELKQRLATQYGLSANSILDYNEYMAKRKNIPAGMKYNVIVAPGEGDISANDPNIISTLLLKH